MGVKRRIPHPLPRAREAIRAIKQVVARDLDFYLDGQDTAIAQATITAAIAELRVTLKGMPQGREKINSLRYWTRVCFQPRVRARWQGGLATVRGFALQDCVTLGVIISRFE